jgi:hypothetical protein
MTAQAVILTAQAVILTAGKDLNFQRLFTAEV